MTDSYISKFKTSIGSGDGKGSPKISVNIKNIIGYVAAVVAITGAKVFRYVIYTQYRKGLYKKLYVRDCTFYNDKKDRTRSQWTEVSTIEIACFRKMMQNISIASLYLLISIIINTHSANAADDACISNFFVSVESTIANAIPVTDGNCDDYCSKTFVDETNYVSISYKKGKITYTYVEPTDGVLKKSTDPGLEEEEILLRAKEFLACKYGEIKNVKFEFAKKDGAILKYGLGGNRSRETCEMKVFGAIMIDRELGHIVAFVRAGFRDGLCFDAGVKQ